MFKEQIEFLSANYNIITMQELIAAYNKSYDLPDNSVLLTFDDGYDILDNDELFNIYAIDKRFDSKEIVFF